MKACNSAQMSNNWTVSAALVNKKQPKPMVPARPVDARDPAPWILPAGNNVDYGFNGTSSGATEGYLWVNRFGFRALKL